MKYLIILRHGEYNAQTLNLNQNGKKQIVEILKKIEALIDGYSTIMLTSSAPYAEHTARIISGSLEVPSYSHTILWSDEDHPADCNKVYELQKSFQQKPLVVILVTHLEFTDEYPKYFASVEGWNKDPGYGGLEEGQAWVLDCVLQKKYLL